MIEFQDLADNYKHCYGKNQLKFGSKPVLTVIDCVKAYHDPKSPLYAPERFEIALKSILGLIEKCLTVVIPVVYVSVIYETPNAGGKWHTEKLPNVLCCYDAGNPFRKFVEGVEPRKKEGWYLGNIQHNFVWLFYKWVCKSYCSRFHAIWIQSLRCEGSLSGPAQVVNDNNLFDMDSKFAEVVLEDEMMTMIDGLKKQ